MPLITDEEAVTQMLGAKITCTISVATAEVDKQFLIHLVGGVRKLQRDADLKVLDKIKAGWVETYNEQVVICRNLREAHGLELEAERKKWAEKIADRIENCLNISPKELPRKLTKIYAPKTIIKPITAADKIPKPFFTFSALPCESMSTKPT